MPVGCCFDIACSHFDKSIGIDIGNMAEIEKQATPAFQKRSGIVKLN